MKRIGLLAIVLVALCTGCAKPRIDTSNDETTRRSVARVRESLPEGRRAAFDEALSAVAMSRFDLGKLLSGQAGFGAMESDVKQALNGKTGDELIEYAARLANEREEKERQQALSEIKELEAKQQAAAEAKRQLTSFQVVRSRFYKTHREFLGDQPIIELTVSNGTGHAVSRAYFVGTLASPGRSVPWHRDDFNHEIPGGLEPGESATWHLAPNMFSDWGRVDAPPDAVFTAEAVRLEGADGQVLFDARAFSDTDAGRLAALKAKFKP